jgi:hypothetical protein
VCVCVCVCVVQQARVPLHCVFFIAVEIIAMENARRNLLLSLCIYLFICFISSYTFRNDKCNWFLNMLWSKLLLLLLVLLSSSSSSNTPSHDVSLTI